MVVFYDVFTDSEIGFTKMHEFFCGCLFGWASAKFGFSLIAAADSPHMSVI